MQRGVAHGSDAREALRSLVNARSVVTSLNADGEERRR